MAYHCDHEGCSFSTEDPLDLGRHVHTAHPGQKLLRTAEKQARAEKAPKPEPKPPYFTMPDIQKLADEDLLLARKMWLVKQYMGSGQSTPAQPTDFTALLGQFLKAVQLGLESAPVPEGPEPLSGPENPMMAAIQGLLSNPAILQMAQPLIERFLGGGKQAAQ